MEWDNLLSGAIGSLIGALVAAGIYIFHERRSAISHLRGLLIELRDRAWNMPVSESDCANTNDRMKEIWFSMYHDIYKAFLTFQDFTIPECRAKYRKAWEQFKGKMQTLEFESRFMHKVLVPPHDGYELEKRIDTLMDALGISE